MVASIISFSVSFFIFPVYYVYHFSLTFFINTHTYLLIKNGYISNALRDNMPNVKNNGLLNIKIGGNLKKKKVIDFYFFLIKKKE